MGTIEQAMEETTAYEIRQIGQAIMVASIRAEEMSVTTSYINEMEAGAKRILRLVEKLKANAEKEQTNERTTI